MSPSRKPGLWRSLWGSVAFRLTLSYGFLAVMSTAALLVFIYLQTVGILHDQVTRQTVLRAQYLSAQFEHGGPAALIAAINAVQGKKADAGRDIYLYLDRDGRRLAGNLNQMPAFDESSLPGAQISISRGGFESQVSVHRVLLDDGSLLLVGHDLDDMANIKAMIGGASLAAELVALFLVAFGSYIFRKELQYRVEAIRQAAVRISAGQFRQRIPIADSDDEFTYLSRDINDMLDRVEALMEGVRHVTDTIAHELRTPLTRMLGRLRTVQKADTPPAEVLAATQHAIREIENLTTLFDKLLQIAEIEAGAQRCNLVPVDLTHVVANVVDLYGALAEETGISLTLVSSCSYTVLGDADLLASAIANIIDNGVKHALSSVQVQLDRCGLASVRISIRDDGPGIPEDELDNIGTHFYRLDPELAGHGLGLTSVRAIVRLHNGSITFSNKGGLEAAVEMPNLAKR